jgi:hypothetical protein
MRLSKHQFLARFAAFLADHEWQAIEDASEEARTIQEWLKIARG